jgi:predicted dehydrogenase
MSNEIKIAIIGLDTSHSVAFPRLMQAPDCPPELKVEGLRTVSCLRFSTPFTDEETLDRQQKQLEAWGVKVTTIFEEAVADCDAIMLEINDPAPHLEYFARCAELGKPIFLDKPMADTIQNGKAIYDLAVKKGSKVFSASSLRFVRELEEACDRMPNPLFVSTYGPLGKAPAGSWIVWYGVHAFEMLQRGNGRGAKGVFARRDQAGVVALVECDDGRHGVVELMENFHSYAGCLRSEKEVLPFIVDMRFTYTAEMRELARFFRGEEPPLTLEDTLEVMAMLDAAERSTHSGKLEAV